MPYDGPDDAKLPDHIKKMSKASREKWVSIWNKTFQNCRDSDTVGGARSVGDCEGTAFKFANAGVKEITREKCMEMGCGVYRRQADQETAGYNALGGDGQKGCANCMFFMSPNQCTVVQDWPVPISPTGISKFWTAVPEYRSEPIEVVIVEAEGEGEAELSAQQDSKTEGGTELETSTVKEKGMLGKAVDALKGMFHPSTPIPDTHPAGFQFYKQADGSYRWFAWATNQFRDVDNPPEIFEAKAHKEFVAYLDAGGIMPEAWLWHTPGTKWGQTDWVDYADGFLVCSGSVDKGKESVADALSKTDGLKVSHGYKFRYSDEKNGIIGWYRTLEISPLPGDAAANPWTGIELIQQEAKEMFSEKKRNFLVGIIGEDSVKALEAHTGDMAKELSALGVEFKEQAGVDPAETLADALITGIKLPTATENAQAVIESEGFKTLVSTMAEVKAITDQVPGILERLTAVEKSEDEKVAAAMIAKATPGQGTGFRASQEDATKVKAGSEEEKAAPVLPDAWKEQFRGMAAGVAQPDGARAS